MTAQKYNAKDWAKIYTGANVMKMGIATYQDESVYLSNDTLHKSINTLVGKPIVIFHQEVTPENFEEYAVGYVTETKWNELSGQFDCKFILINDEAKEAAANGFSLSTAYRPLAYGNGGTDINTPYDREITDLEFTHLALVPDPRYEDAKIYENSKTGGEKIMFKLFKTKKEEIQNSNAVVELEGGAEIALSDLIQEYQNSKKKEKIVKLNARDEVEIDGKKVKVSELLNACKNNMKKNAEDEDEKKEEELENEEDETDKTDKKEEKDNEDEEEDKKEFEKMKENSKKGLTGSSPYRYWSDVKGLEDGKNLFSIKKI